jgi:hypothetical protein
MSEKSRAGSHSVNSVTPEEVLDAMKFLQNLDNEDGRGGNVVTNFIERIRRKFGWEGPRTLGDGSQVLLASFDEKNGMGQLGLVPADKVNGGTWAWSPVSTLSVKVNWEASQNRLVVQTSAEVTEGQWRDVIDRIPRDLADS